MKRFSETQKWSDPWFMDLPAKWKLMWLYLLDNCDNAGVWTPNMRLAAVQIGEPVETSEALRVFSDRIEVLPTHKWHVPKFVQYQYGQLSAECRPHQQVIALRKQHGLDTLPIPFDKGMNRDKDKDKDKDSSFLSLESEEIDEPKSQKNWKKLSQTDKQKIRIPKNSETMIEVGKCLGRRSSTTWTIAEAESLSMINPSPEEVSVMIEYYQAQIPENDWRCRSLDTLLNNWNRELDKARAWRAQNR